MASSEEFVDPLSIYAISTANDGSNQPLTRFCERFGRRFTFWCCASCLLDRRRHWHWARGGVFGFFLEGFAGLIVGSIIAAVYSIPTQCSAAIVSWALWLQRFRIGFAALAGAATGVWATLLAITDSLYGPFGPLAATAGILGALGAGIATSWMTFKTAVGLELHAAAKARKWQFSLGSLFAHFTVVCVLFACWVLAIGKILETRSGSRAQEEQTMQRLPGDAD